VREVWLGPVSSPEQRVYGTGEIGKGYTVRFTHRSFLLDFLTGDHGVRIASLELLANFGPTPRIMKTDAMLRYRIVTRRKTADQRCSMIEVEAV
jgi:hypothetical protein